jgi:hypothetical protein
LAVCYFGLFAMIAFFTPLFSVYKYSDGHAFVVIVLVQLMLSRLLWEQQFDKKKDIIAVDSDEYPINYHRIY